MPAHTSGRRRTRPLHPRAAAALALLAGLVGGCGAPDGDAHPDGRDDDAPPPASRPAERVDTATIEGAAQPLELRLFRSPADFPIPFSAYAPVDFDAAVEEAAVRFTARFGDTAEPDAFVHLYVFPPGTAREAAIAEAEAYKTGRGVPVSRGLDPLTGPSPPDLAWAIRAFRFRYEAGNRWFTGTIGVGRHADRYFQVVRHYPAEYGDGFAPRAKLILETWRWADGSTLVASSTE